MEKDLAIMIADLSGYTALTEVHGATSAADMIDKFLQIVESSLIGDSHLHERAGDEVMIISEEPEHLLSTALMLLKNTTNEHNFLLPHGGLHFGRLLKRKDSYFGSAINFAARIAAKADAGSIWCSKEFIDAIKNKTSWQFEPKGTYEFKNIVEKKEIFEVVADKASFLVIDPVCRMLLVSENAAIAHPKQNGIFFCSEHCLDIYNAANKDKSD